MVFPNSIYWIIPFPHWFEKLPLLYIEFLQVLGSVPGVSVPPLDLWVLSEAQFLICVPGSSFSPFRCFTAPTLCWASTFSLLSAKRISSSVMAWSMSHALMVYDIISLAQTSPLNSKPM